MANTVQENFCNNDAEAKVFVVGISGLMVLAGLALGTIAFEQASSAECERPALALSVPTPIPQQR